VIGFSQENTGRLLELIAREISGFERIHELTVKQTELIAADEMDALGDMLDGRQEMIEQINGLHQETDILMQSYISFSSGPGGEKNDEIDAVIARLDAVITLCAAADAEFSGLAGEKAEDYIKRIGNLSLTRKSIEKYAPGVPNDSEYFDRKT